MRRRSNNGFKKNAKKQSAIDNLNKIKIILNHIYQRHRRSIKKIRNEFTL